MPDTPSITIVKDFPYRGIKEPWSNTYHFSGTTPTTDAAWRALADAIWGEERKMLRPDVKFRGYLGYQAGNEHAVSIKDLLADGETQTAGQNPVTTPASAASGDVAFWVRWATPQRTSRGKRIYLRKYFHGIGHNLDALQAETLAAANTYAAKMTDGSLPGGFKVCGPQGATAGTAFVSPNVTTRTLKRRGKRPN